MTNLSVNLNKVATLRNTRDHGVPSVIRAATLCLDAGAHGVTVHPRPDRRHITPEDVDDLADLIRQLYPHAELNVEGNPFLGEYMGIVRRIRPRQCTLVPDPADARTSSFGWDRSSPQLRALPETVAELRSLGCRVSLFVAAASEAVELAAELAADRVELYTEPYARAFAHGDSVAEPYAAAARRAAALGLGVNAGHDLNLENLGPFLRAVPGVLEVSIGHALIADALEFGLSETVRRYLAVCA